MLEEEMAAQARTLAEPREEMRKLTKGLKSLNKVKV